MNQHSNNISILLLTKNSSEKLKTHWTWLSKVPSINEIVIIDDNSTDETLKTAKKLFSKIKLQTFKRCLDNDFSAQRNFGISKTKNDWILWLDSDEKPSKEMIKYLNNFDFNSNFSYDFKRLDYFLGTPLYHGETANISFTRLFNKKNGQFKRPVHEIWESSVPIKKLDYQILHYSHETFKEFIEKINFYSSIRAGELYQQKISSPIVSILIYPLAKFLHNYIFRFGFLDSTAGIVIALGMSFHSFLVRAKLWHLWQN